MKLTPRQRVFLQRLCDLTAASGPAVHYSQLAAELGVSKFSAYDMLRVLEDKGAVRSEYVLDQPNSGPGRSMIVFRPTPAGEREAWRAEAGEPRSSRDDGQDWEGSRQRLLDLLRNARNLDSREAARDILNRLSATPSPLVYCGQVVTALLMNLKPTLELAAGAGRISLSAVGGLIPSGDTGLSTLIGLSVGASLTPRLDSPVVEEFLTHTRLLQSLLVSLSEESRRTLAEFLGEAIATVDQP